MPYKDPHKAAEVRRRWAVANREKAAAARRRWKANNKEKQRAFQADWKKRNPEKVRAYSRANYLRLKATGYFNKRNAANKKALAAAHREWVAAHPARYRAAQEKYWKSPHGRKAKTKRARAQVENLASHYIRSLIARDSGLLHRQIPQELVELKRTTLLIKRHLKELTNGCTEEHR